MSDDNMYEEDKNINNNQSILRDSTFATDNDSNFEHPDSPESIECINYQEIASAHPLSMEILDSEIVTASESLAIQYLEQNFNDGTITGSEMAFYKKRFQLLCDILEKSRESEFSLSQLSKKWTFQIEKDKVLLSQSDNFPEDSNSEISKARQTLLKFKNDQMSIDDRLSTMDYQILRLQEEKKMMEHEMKRLPGIRDKELRHRLENSTDEMKSEITKLVSENKALSEIYKENKEKNQELSEENDSNNEKINSFKSKMVEINSLLPQTLKIYEKIRKEKIDQDDTLKFLYDELGFLEKSANEYTLLILKNKEELEICKTEYNNIEQDLILSQNQLDDIKKIIQQSKIQEIEMLQDKQKIEFDLNTILNEKKKAHDEFTNKSKIKEITLKELKISELQLKSSKESLEITKQSLDRTKIDYELYPKSDVLIKEGVQKRLKEIEHSSKLFDVQKLLSETEKAKLTKFSQDEERLLYDLSDLRIQAVELKRLAQIKADEREQKAKEFYQKDKRFNEVIEELKEKKLLIQDLNKSFIETQTKLDASAKLYNIIQSERNKFANTINAVTQKGSEMKEKSRILDNEIEILKTNLTQKENLIHKQRTKFAELLSIRDSLRSEISKQKGIITNHDGVKNQFRLDIQRLNFLCNQSEETLMRLRGKHDIALRNRNDRAVQLIERNEEVCILQDKYHIKEEIIKGGLQEIQTREDEIDLLQQNIKEYNRQLKLLKQNQSEKKNYEKLLINLKIQLSICQERQLELEKKVENPETYNRTRTLSGKDLTPFELQKKLEDLNVQLSEKDESIMEKDFLYEAIIKLVDTLENKIGLTKVDTLNLATSLNEYKSQMAIIIKKLKAMTAELTMNMSKSLKFQQDIKKNEKSMQEFYEMMENNEKIFIKDPSKKIIENINILGFGNHQYQLTDGTVTTAEPRPNAYIPENESDLPIPRPYGSHAPFKPTEPGTNMRHIKKQKLKPIEI